MKTTGNKKGRAIIMHRASTRLSKTAKKETSRAFNSLLCFSRLALIQRGRSLRCSKYCKRFIYVMSTREKERKREREREKGLDRKRRYIPVGRERMLPLYIYRYTYIHHVVCRPTRKSREAQNRHRKAEGMSLSM